ncbi:unnamed protein product, partial [marine sediment metagenome]
SLILFTKKYGMINPETIKLKGKAAEATAIYDYVCWSERTDEQIEKIHLLAVRRWDVFHLLSATWLSLPIGVLVGSILRLCYPLYISCSEKSIFVLMGISIIILLCILFKGRTWVEREMGLLTRARILSFKRRYNLRKLFPSELFKISTEEDKHH